METRPSLRALFQQSTRANLKLEYLLFYDAAHLTPEQIDKFEELTIESKQDALDLQATAKAQNLAANDPLLAKIKQESDEKHQKAQKEVLGEDGYEVLQRYDRQKGLSGFATFMDSTLAYEGIPMTASQCRQLFDAFSNASPQFQAGGRADIGTVDTSRAILEARRIFSPEQFAVLQPHLRMIELSKLSAEFFRQKKAAAK
jgi:hypothetical protein